jgi:hypothetical protein
VRPRRKPRLTLLPVPVLSWSARVSNLEVEQPAGNRTVSISAMPPGTNLDKLRIGRKPELVTDFQRKIRDSSRKGELYP